MSGLVYLIGEPITQFSGNRLPTVRNVLCFYGQYWGAPGSDSRKAKIVARGLIEIYEREDIPVLSEKTIKDKITVCVAELRSILKFKNKSKTPANVRKEHDFCAKLDEIFEIRRLVHIDGNENEIESMSFGSDSEYASESDFMDIEISCGKWIFFVFADLFRIINNQTIEYVRDIL